MNASFKGKMAQEIAEWENVGLISAAQAGLLHQRYDPAPFRGAVFLKWLGLFAISMLGMSFLGFIGTVLVSFSPLFSTLCLMAVSYLVMHFGARLAAEKAQKHPFTGQALLTIGLIGLYASLSSIYLVSGGDKYSNIYGWFMLITSAAALLTAYHFRLRWPLLIALLMFFHGIGSMSEYWGQGAYFLSVQDARSMSVVALLTIMLGYWHEHELETTRLQHCIGFGSLYLIFGLLYFNLSLWILSLQHNALWVLLFTVGGIAQIVAGARLKDSRYTGFGIVFLGINLYTRFYEYFWDEMSKAAFFTLAGIIALGLAYVFERQLKTGKPA
ncbi:MAG: hypothetical protein L0Y43_11970 [Methylococcaceae bacterium]|nr:hypothetical protein [Methylococcaceae bacterium]